MLYLSVMGRKSTLVITEELSDLKLRRAKLTNNRQVKKLECLIALKLKKFTTLDEVARSVGANPSSLDIWLKKYREEGLDALLEKETRQRNSNIITEEIHQGLVKRLNDPRDSFSGFWDAQQWVTEQYGVNVEYQWLWKYMTTKLGAKLKRPRKSNVKKDPMAEEAFLKTP